MLFTVYCTSVGYTPYAPYTPYTPCISYTSYTYYAPYTPYTPYTLVHLNKPYISQHSLLHAYAYK